MILPILLFLLLAFAGPTFVDASPTKQDLLHRLARPVFDGGSWSHPFGTDSLGRDILARVAEGARYSLLVGIVAASGTAVIGVTLGMIAGAGSAFADRIVTLLTDVVMAVPFVVIGIVLTAILGQSLTNVLAILIVSGWVGYARIVRLQTRGLVGAEFVLASVAMGASRPHLVLRHLLPNLLPILLTLFFQQIAAMMLFEASLTYLGLGLPVQRITLGGMVQAGQQQIFNDWWASLFPGGAIALAVVGFNLLADWLQERRDPFRRWA